MLENLYEWIRQITCYLILVTVVMQVVPGEGYRRYIRLFTGMILVMMITAPILRFLGSAGEEGLLQTGEEYEAAAERIEEKMQQLQQDAYDGVAQQEERMAEGEDTGSDTDPEPGGIEVEEIRIGR